MPILIPQMVAIATVDPGRVTGVARGVFYPADADSVAEAFSAGDEIESWEVEGSPEEQASEIAEELRSWFADQSLAGVPTPDLQLVFEDFQLRTQQADLSPVRVTAAFEALWHWEGLTVALQSPSDAKAYATNDRLRRWGAWVVGSEHRRDAMRHLLVRLSRLLDGVNV